MVRVSQLIDSIDLDYVLGEMLKIITETVEAYKGSIFLLDEKLQPVQRFLTQRALPPEMTRQVAHDVLDKGLAGWCVRHGQGAIVPDISQDGRWHIFPDDHQQDVRSAMCVLLQHEGRTLGVLTLVNPNVAHFHDEHLQIVQAIANQAGLAIRNAQLIDHLESQQHEMRLMLETVSDALLALDAQLNVRLINRRARELLGVAPGADVAGQPLAQLAGASVYTQVVSRLQDPAAIEQAANIIVRDEPNQKDYALQIARLGQPDQQSGPGYVTVLHDVTTIRDVDRLKTQMLQMLSHNLKNPMNIVWGYVDLLRIDSEDGKSTDPRFVDSILRALQRMEILIDETLAASRHITEDFAMLQRDVFAPTKTISDLLYDMNSLAEAKSLTIVRDIQPDMAPFLAWAFQMREAMANLLGNAIKYTPEGGTLTVQARRDDERFSFSVQDTGIGIPGHLQAQLFTEYYRAERPALREIPGTGLGLSLVKKIVQAHEGDVWFQSKEHDGSTFGLWVPVVPLE